MTENLYMYYFHIGYRDILYLTNGLDSSTFYFPNNAFMNSVSHNFLKDVVQVDFREKYKMIEEIGEGTFSKVFFEIIFRFILCIIGLRIKNTRPKSFLR
jgi:type IV secretory pathway TrbL component